MAQTSAYDTESGYQNALAYCRRGAEFELVKKLTRRGISQKNKTYLAGL